MAGFRVQVIGKKPIDAKLPAELPMPVSSYALVARPTHETVEVVFPKRCPCCAGEVDEGATLELNKVKGWGGYTPTALVSWQVPYCRACLEHVALKQQRPAASAALEIGMVLVALISVFSLVQTNIVLGAVLFVIVIAAGIASNAWILRRYERETVHPAMKANCAAPAPAILYQGWNSDGTRHQFLLLNETYAQYFAQANHSPSITPVK